MKDKREPQTWQELLQQVIQNPEEKKRIVQQANIQAITLTRWIKGISTPRVEKLRSLLKALPRSSSHTFEQLISVDFPNFSLKPTGESQNEPSEIPQELYMRVLKTYASTPSILCQHMLRNLIFQQMIKHFDPGCSGLTIRITRCLWNRTENKVRSLQIVQEVGIPPWGSDRGQRMILLGAESLAGIAVMKNRPIGASNRVQDSRVDPLCWGEYEQSVLACPLMRQRRIAGCLLIASTQPDAFSEAHHELSESYAHLVALSFEPEAFFHFEDIALHMMPPSSCQELLFRQFHQRVLQKVQRHHLTLSEARECVWQEIEEELIAISFSEESLFPSASSEKFATSES